MRTGPTPRRIPALAAACVCAFAGAASADQRPPGPTASRPSAPVGAEVGALISQLGAADFKAREAAMKRLIEIGTPSRPALQRKLRDRLSTEIRARIEGILAEPYGPTERARQFIRMVRTAPLVFQGASDLVGQGYAQVSHVTAFSDEEVLAVVPQLIEMLSEPARLRIEWRGGGGSAIGVQVRHRALRALNLLGDSRRN